VDIFLLIGNVRTELSFQSQVKMTIVSVDPIVQSQLLLASVNGLKG